MRARNLRVPGSEARLGYHAGSVEESGFGEDALFDRTRRIRIGPIHGAEQISDPKVWCALTIESGPTAVVGAYDTTDVINYVKRSEVREDASGLPARFAMAGDFACCTFPEANLFVLWDFSDVDNPVEADRVSIPGNPTDWSVEEIAPGTFGIHVATTEGPYWCQFESSAGEVTGQGLLQTPAGWGCDHLRTHVFEGGQLGLFCNDLDDPVVHSLPAPDLALTAETSIP